MRLFFTLFISLLSTILLVQGCPLDEIFNTSIMKPLGDKLNQVCEQGIKIGSTKDIRWLQKNILPYYISKNWLTKKPPYGWQSEVDKIIHRCHRSTYNYCLERDRNKVADCFKGMTAGLMLKYGSTLLAFCPILDTIAEEWSTKHEGKAMFWISEYCKTKGTTC